MSQGSHKQILQMLKVRGSHCKGYWSFPKCRLGVLGIEEDFKKIHGKLGLKHMYLGAIKKRLRANSKSSQKHILIKRQL